MLDTNLYLEARVFANSAEEDGGCTGALLVLRNGMSVDDEISMVNETGSIANEILYTITLN